jgi:hypothetical protein
VECTSQKTIFPNILGGAFSSGTNFALAGIGYVFYYLNRWGTFFISKIKNIQPGNPADRYAPADFFVMLLE